MSVGFDVALSALNAARRGIGVAGHNLANAATRGFSRQRVLVTQAAPEYVRPGLSVGRGVEISGVDRVVDDFLAARLRDQRSQFGVAIVRRDLHREAEAAFGEPGENGLNARLGAFFEEIRGLAYQPGDAAAQAGMIQRTGDLAQAFRGVRAAVVAVRRSAADSVVAESRNVNGVLAQIARLNDSVTAAGYGTNLPPDVQDRFESLFDELSGLIDVRVSKTPSGRYLVASSGVALVDSSGYRALDAIRGQTETDPTVIRLRGTTLEFKPKSGSLRGALDLDADLTGERLNVLDGVAKSLIRSVNHAHATGVPPSGGFTRTATARSSRSP
jgi:flagellar hook-associated protein 1